MIDHQKIESLSVGLLSPSHLQRRQLCQVDGWCDGERLTLHVRKTHGRFSMHLCPQKIRKVATRKVVRVLRKVSLKQKLCSWLLLSPVRQYKWRWERAWESSEITSPADGGFKTSALKVKFIVHNQISIRVKHRYALVLDFFICYDIINTTE